MKRIAGNWRIDGIAIVCALYVSLFLGGCRSVTPRDVFTVAVRGNISIEDCAKLRRAFVIPSASANRLFVADGILYVASFRGREVSVIDLQDHAEIGRIPMDAYELYFHLDSNGEKLPAPRREVRRYPAGDLAVTCGKLFVAQTFSDYVVVIDIPTKLIVHRIPVGGYGKFAISANGDTLYYACNNKNVFYVINANTYHFSVVPFPNGGRGIGSIATSPDGHRLYLGIQRGGVASDGRQHGSGNPYLAVYDLVAQEYIGTVHLARIGDDFTNDNGLPWDILPTKDGALLYVGMGQSEAGILVIDTQKLEIAANIAFVSNQRNKHFKWVDPMALAFYDGLLLSVNRNNAELAVVETGSNRVRAIVDLGNEMHEGTSLVVDGNTAYVAHHGREGIVAIDLTELKYFVGSARPKNREASNKRIDGDSE